ncbi:MAG: transposase [Pseudonocardiaceae bacterium]
MCRNPPQPPGQDLVFGRPCHIAVDTFGLLLCVFMIAASVQDRDGARPPLEQLASSGRWVRLVWADGGYAGKLVDCARTGLEIAAIRYRHGVPSPAPKLHRERTLARITSHRDSPHRFRNSF